MRPVLIFNLLFLCFGLILVQLHGASLKPKNDISQPEFQYTARHIPQLTINAIQELWSIIKQLLNIFYNGAGINLNSMQSIANIFSALSGLKNYIKQIWNILKIT